jgi:hypothetical protein
MKKDLITDDPIEVDGEYKLLENISINDRSLICWYNGDDKTYNISIFHLTDQPNSISKKSPLTTWGYCTFSICDIESVIEAAEVVGLYLQDMEKANYWWETDND